MVFPVDPGRIESHVRSLLLILGGLADLPSPSECLWGLLRCLHHIYRLRASLVYFHYHLVSSMHNAVLSIRTSDAYADARALSSGELVSYVSK